MSVLSFVNRVQAGANRCIVREGTSRHAGSCHMNYRTLMSGLEQE